MFLRKRIPFSMWILAFTSFNIWSTVLMQNTTSTTPKLSTPTLPPTKNCGTKRNFTVCWASSPPYVFYKADEKKVSGILIEALQKALDEVCDAPTRLIFRKEVQNQKGIENCTLANDISFIIPFKPYPAGESREKRFVPFVESPGMVLVLNQKKLTDEAMSKALNEVLQVWTVVVLIFLLAAIFGILVWFLDMHRNPEEFPQSFYPGALEGLWWSFVTLTTVGYGDKAPRYPLARFFSIIWMFVGMVMVSLLTATMITALTSGRSDSFDNLVEKKIGVLVGSPSSVEAARKGARTVKFDDLVSLYNALGGKKLDGILVDSLIASFVPNNYEISMDLFKASSYGFSYKHGAIVGNAELNSPQSGLFLEDLQWKKDAMQTFVHNIIDQFVRGRSNIHEKEKISKQYVANFNIFEKNTDAFKTSLLSLGVILAFMILCGIIWEVISRGRRRKSRNISTKGKDMLSMDTHIKLTPVEVRQMLDRLDELEKTLTQLSEFRQMYRRLKVDIQSYDVNEQTANGHGVANTGYGFP